MELDADMSETLVDIVRAKSGAKGSRIPPINKPMTTMANNAQLRTCGVVGQSLADFSALTFEQRRATRAIADGKISTVKADVLETLMRCDLLKYDGQGLVLTAVGRALSHQC